MFFIGRDLIKNCSGLIEKVISLFISKKEGEKDDNGEK